MKEKNRAFTKLSRYFLGFYVLLPLMLYSLESQAGSFKEWLDQIVERRRAERAKELDTWGIADKSMQCTDCMNYKIEGVCIWLKCKPIPPSCETETSPFVSHFLPDFVVSVYSNNSPWDGLGDLTDRKMGSIFTQKNDWATDTPTNEADSNLDFKHADVITNPGILAFNALASSLGYSCKSVESIPMLPHYVSKHDPAWSEAIVEQYYPEAILGYPRQSALPEFWGPIYPRTGWNSLPFDALSALVTAERASEIVTGAPSLHVYVPPGNDCGDKCWPPPPVYVGDTNNRFQMIYPKVEDDAKTLPRHGKWSRGMEVTDQRYSWVLWRHYECCERKGQVFVERVQW
jgi:integrating conjugative element protein (TIGR03756 family)